MNTYVIILTTGTHFQRPNKLAHQAYSATNKKNARIQTVSLFTLRIRPASQNVAKDQLA
jgi:hypothetical protein